MRVHTPLCARMSHGGLSLLLGMSEMYAACSKYAEEHWDRIHHAGFDKWLIYCSREEGQCVARIQSCMNPIYYNVTSNSLIQIPHA